MAEGHITPPPHHRRTSSNSSHKQSQQGQQQQHYGKNQDKNTERQSEPRPENPSRHHSEAESQHIAIGQGGAAASQHGLGDRGTIESNGVKKTPIKQFNVNDSVELKATLVHYIVTGCEYNPLRNGWDYDLDEAGPGGMPYHRQVQQTEIRRRKKK